MAGLFFCLASAEGAGLLFCPAAIQTHTSVYSGFSCDCALLTANDTRPTQAAIIPPVQRWSVSQRRSTSSTYQIPPPRRTLYRSAQTAYYNKVYKGASVRTCYGSMPDGAAYRRPCQPGGGLDAPNARRLAIWHRVSNQGAPDQPCTLHQEIQPSSRGAAGGAEPLAALAASLFGLSPDI